MGIPECSNSMCWAHFIHMYIDLNVSTTNLLDILAQYVEVLDIVGLKVRHSEPQLGGVGEWEIPALCTHVHDNRPS